MVTSGSIVRQYRILITGQELIELKKKTAWMGDVFDLDKRIRKYKGRHPISFNLWELENLRAIIRDALANSREYPDKSGSEYEAMNNLSRRIKELCDRKYNEKMGADRMNEKEWFTTNSEVFGPLPWIEVKRRLTGRSEKELITLLGECYKIGPDVKVKLSLALSEDSCETKKIISDLKKRLRDAFWATEKNGCPKGPDIMEAGRIISIGRNSTDDSIALLDLMMDHFQHGVGYTLHNGDMWEGYYASIENMFEKTCDYIITHRSEIDVGAVLAMIDIQIKKTEVMGWGFHDNLSYIRNALDARLKE